MRLSDFAFELPPERIAQAPTYPAVEARLLCVGPEGLADHRIGDLPRLLRQGDIVVANDTKVIPAALEGKRGRARIGITLDHPKSDGSWFAIARNARRLHAGDTISFACDLAATVLDSFDDGTITLRFNHADPTRFARLALPPYMHRPAGPLARDLTDYQTVFAALPGAVAAPTAGLHFTPELLEALAVRGIGLSTVTLHVGAGTFLPLRTEDLAGVRLHAERGTISEPAARAINEAREKGGRLVAIGTTTLRLLESAADPSGSIHPFAGATRLFIKPGHRFLSAELLLTNFHLPRSSLFVLVSAFAGTARMHAAYAHAIAAHYRFYSYGDACLLSRALSP